MACQVSSPVRTENIVQWAQNGALGLSTQQSTQERDGRKSGKGNERIASLSQIDKLRLAPARSDVCFTIAVTGHAQDLRTIPQTTEKVG